MSVLKTKKKSKLKKLVSSLIHYKIADSLYFTILNMSEVMCSRQYLIQLIHILNLQYLFYKKCIRIMIFMYKFNYELITKAVI